jgi:hypothetical protein
VGSCEILVDLAAELPEAYTNDTGLAYGGKPRHHQLAFTLNDHQSVEPLVCD